MESGGVIAFRDAYIGTSSHTNADVIVTRAAYNDVDRHVYRSKGRCSSNDENLQFVEAVPMAASELKNGQICPWFAGDVTRESTTAGSESHGRKQPNETTDDGEEDLTTPAGNEHLDGEQRSGCSDPFFDCDASEGGKVAAEEEKEAEDGQNSLVKIMERLALQSNGDTMPRTDCTEEEKESRSTDGTLQPEETLESVAEVLARGPTGGIAVAFPPQNNPINSCYWTEQSYPRVNGSALPDFAYLRDDIMIDALTVVGGSFSTGDYGILPPTKFRKGPQPVESEDLSSPLDDLPFPFAPLSPRAVEEYLGSADCQAVLEDFLLTGSFYNMVEQPLKVKEEAVQYSPGDVQFRNGGSVIGELFPSAVSPVASSTFRQHPHQDHPLQQQPSSSVFLTTTPTTATSPFSQTPTLSAYPATPTTNPTTATSPFSQVPTLSAYPTGQFFQPLKTNHPTQFCNGTQNHGSCAGFQAAETNPLESGLGSPTYSPSPSHPSMKDSPGHFDVLSPEPQQNLAEIEKIFYLIEKQVLLPNVNQQATLSSPKYRFPLENPPPGKRQTIPASSANILPPITNPLGKQPANPPSTKYPFPLENPPVSQTVGQFQHPPAVSFHPVHSPPFQQINNSSLVSSSTSPPHPAAGPIGRSQKRTIKEECPASEQIMRRLSDTNSGVAGNHRKDQSLAERKQLAKASSVIARLTTQQLVTTDADQDTLLHLSIAKNERYLTEALICRLDRDKLTDSMINARNKQGQTPLCLATVTNQSTLVRLLVDRGADVNVLIPLGAKLTKQSFCNPLHFAASNGKDWLRTLEELLQAKSINLSAPDSDGFSALHKAVMANGLSLFNGRSCETIDSRESVRQLVIHGIDISQQDGLQSRTALSIALERGDLDLFYYILDLANNYSRGSLPLLLNARTGRRGDTLLHVAANLQTADSAHQLIAIRQMLNRGANPQLRNWDNRLPWELATRPQVAELLRASVGAGLWEEETSVRN